MQQDVKVTEYLEEESDLVFKVIKIETEDYHSVDVSKYIHSELCKIIIKDRNLTRTHYFKDYRETSLDNIVKQERLNFLRR